ncbi:MAG: hypothetical protein ACLRH0_11955 [Blautia wexlerae]
MVTQGTVMLVAGILGVGDMRSKLKFSSEDFPQTEGTAFGKS